MNMWSYSMPADQFGAKPYSKPTPTTPPQRVSLAEASSAEPGLVTIVYLSSTTAAPPFT